jgi:hypothetical protein
MVWVDGRRIPESSAQRYSLSLVLLLILILEFAVQNTVAPLLREGFTSPVIITTKIPSELTLCQQLCNPQQFYEIGTSIILILQKRELRLKSSNNLC